MLSLAKIGPARGRGSRPGGYASYLEAEPREQASDFDDYARRPNAEAPRPFWACKGAALLGLDAEAEAAHVERLARGMHPLTGAELVKGAGDGHVMGLDMTFSAPKDFSAAFAGADGSTRDALLEALRESAKAALSHAESVAVTRHGKAGGRKQTASAAVAACYTHFASRALDPHLHIHALLMNAAQRADGSWSAMEARAQFDSKMSTGILFRCELAWRLKGLGFGVEARGPYFEIDGIDDSQRGALSTRSAEIARRMREDAAGASGAARDRAALETRGAKAEPPLPELLARFQSQAAELGLTPARVAEMRALGAAKAAEPPFEIDHAELAAALMASQSCATASEALAAICERAMGRWPASRCLAELDRFLESALVVPLGVTETLSPVFTSKATLELEAEISARVSRHAGSTEHRVAAALVTAEFDKLEAELSAKLGAPVSLSEQRGAALFCACETGRHAFVEGWAGTGKTTMLKAAAAAWEAGGMRVMGCSQSAAASWNLEREAGIPSRTIASLLLAEREGRSGLGPGCVLVLDEAGMVGSREFSALQEAALRAGAKLVCVGDPKQLQPIEAGGIHASLMRAHGRAEISKIQRQRTDFEPLARWLSGPAGRRAGVEHGAAEALRALPEDARHRALEALAESRPKLRRAVDKWRSRFDHEWMRDVVEKLAKGEAAEALRALDSRGRLSIHARGADAFEALASAWDADKTELRRKAIVAATRADVAALNALARARLAARGLVDDARGADWEIERKDGSREARRFAPGDRVVFSKNDRRLGVANGVSGTVAEAKAGSVDMPPILVVKLDDANDQGRDRVEVPYCFGWLDHGYCVTNHKAQGRTVDAAYVLANPSMLDREWSYVACSRSRFATTLFADASALGLADPERHGSVPPRAAPREAAIEALARRMSRSRAKGTTLDYPREAQPRGRAGPDRGGFGSRAAEASREAVAALMRRLRERRFEKSPEAEPTL